MERQILSNATDNGAFDFNINIGLRDDSIREPDEYFLLVLKAHQPPPNDSITLGRDCMRIVILADQDREPLINYDCT